MEFVDTHELYAQIGQLKVENEFLIKVSRNLGCENPGLARSTAGKRAVYSPAVWAVDDTQKPAVLQTGGWKVWKYQDDGPDG